MITAIGQIVADATTCNALMSDHNACMIRPSAKLDAMANKLKGKLDKSDTERQLCAPNTRRLEDGQTEDLRAAGRKLDDQALKLVEQLPLLSNLASSLSEDDVGALRYSPHTFGHATMKQLAVELICRLASWSTPCVVMPFAICGTA